MNASPLNRSRFFSVLLLGGLLALLAATPSRAYESFRLDRLATVRYSALPNGKLRRQEGVLLRDGRFLPRLATEVERPANTPSWSLDRDLIPIEAWAHYRALGFEATGHFSTLGGAWFFLGETKFFLVEPDDAAGFAAGRLINLSTRARIAPGGQSVIAGFVIEDQPRYVLVRAVGPTLIRFGLGTAATDPKLTLRRGGTVLHANDNWTESAEFEAIRDVTPHLGAFALDAGSKDAALLILLEPGAYTAEVTPATPTLPGGDVLIEVYSVPDLMAITGEPTS